MAEPFQYKQIDMSSPQLQNLSMSLTIGGVAYELSHRLGVSPAIALDMFYRSKTCANLHDKKTGLYLMGNAYIADDFISEKPVSLHLEKTENV